MRHMFQKITTLITFLLLGVGASVVHATTVSGTFKYNGTPFNGSMTFTLIYPGTTGSYLNLPLESAPFAINNGSFLSFIVDGNDTMLPSKTYYVASLYDPYGNVVTRLPYYITGSSFDLGAAVPTPVLANNLSFLDLLGLRSLSVQQLTILSGGSLSFGPMTLSSSGITGALQVNSILYAAAYAAQFPSTTTCGINEAISALPSVLGGTIILPNTDCAITTSITISKPVRIIGMGGGGYQDALNTVWVAPTMLVNRVPSSGPMIVIAPSSGAYLSGVELSNFGIDTAFGFHGPLIVIGLANDSGTYVNDVTLRNIAMKSGLTYGVDVQGNLTHLLIDHCNIWDMSIAGLHYSDTFPGFTAPAVPDTTITSTTFGSTAHLQRGIMVESSGVGVINIMNSTITGSNTAAIQISGASSNAQIHSVNNVYTNTIGAGLDLESGYSHTSSADSFLTNSTYGVLVNNAPAGGHSIIIRDATWGGNTTADIHLAQGVTLLYPSANITPTHDGGATLQVITTTPATPY